MIPDMAALADISRLRSSIFDSKTVLTNYRSDLMLLWFIFDALTIVNDVDGGWSKLLGQDLTGELVLQLQGALLHMRKNWNWKLDHTYTPEEILKRMNLDFRNKKIYWKHQLGNNIVESKFGTFRQLWEVMRHVGKHNPSEALKMATRSFKDYTTHLSQEEEAEGGEEG